MSSLGDNLDRADSGESAKSGNTGLSGAMGHNYFLSADYSQQQLESHDSRVLESEESAFEHLAEHLAQQDAQDRLEETLANTPLKRQYSSSYTDVTDIRPTGKRSRSALSSLDWSHMYTSGINTPSESEIFVDVLMGNNVEDSSEIFVDVLMGNNVEDSSGHDLYDPISSVCEDEPASPSKWEAELVDLIYQKHLPNMKFELGEFEDVICQEEKSMSTTKVCYGAIHNIRIKVLPQASELIRSCPIKSANLETLEEYLRQDLYILNVCRDENGRKFLLQPPKAQDKEKSPFNNIAVLNQEANQILLDIAPFCAFSSYSSVEQWISVIDGTSEAEKNTCVFLDLVIYGDEEVSGKVGNILDSNKVFLQDPDYRDLDLVYKNPHFMDLEVDPKTHTDLDISQLSFTQADTGVELQFSEEQATTQTLLKQRITAAFKTMTRAQNLKRIAANMRVRTPLLDYQEEALDFIMQRETGLISGEYRLWKPTGSTTYTHIITSSDTCEKPVEAGGGILADEMGLGKTLTMLSAIIGSTDEAKTFTRNLKADETLNGEQSLIPSRATLVITPSPLLLNEWLQEISLHCTGFSNPIIYHGRGREGNASVLADSDIVLSTYHTIAAESTDPTSPLLKIHWFRIVLDEAHIIRRMTTRLFKAVKRLHANIRWCLTGTPIQNSLEDLAALVSFIRCSPLDKLQQFRKYIVSPLLKQSEKGVEGLRLLLDSICLRRTQDLLNLPEVIPEIRFLAFSTVEKKQYIDTRERFIQTMNQRRLQPQTKSYLGVFQLQLQLRRLCNHGTFQKTSFEVEDFDPEQALAFLKVQKEAKCDVCSVNVTGIHGIEEQRSGCFTVCGHLLCSKCIPKMQKALQKIDGKDACQMCSLCPEIFSGEYLQMTIETSTRPSQSKNNISALQYFDKNGCSTKISALVSDIEQHKTEGKSIIFSCWTRSLDLIGIFLKSRDINFVRIDGSHTLGQRKSILKIYQNDPDIKILLMTTGTGAVGLNLTVANCVYILEPQWNPMVENQAIARVNRLGQKRNVRVVRYIMKETVEEIELQAQQIRKLEYAKIGWKKD